MTEPLEPASAPEDADGRGLGGDARVDAALSTFFADRLAGASFEAIDPIAIVAGRPATPGPARRRRVSRKGWLALAAAASLLVAIALGVGRWWEREPPILGLPEPAPSPTASVLTPSAWDPDVGEWTLTAPSPLESRYDALSFYAEGRYYILGGYAGLTWEVLNNDRGLHGEPVFDGASYDPLTNSWTSLPSVEGVFPWVTASSAAAVVDGRLYVVSPLGAPAHVYSGDPPATGERVAAVLDLRSGGEWTMLPEPPATDARADQVLMAGDDGLFLFADTGSSGAADYVYDFSTGAWAALPRPPQQSLEARRVAVVDDTHLLLQTSTAFGPDGAEIAGGYAILDLATRSWRSTDMRYSGTGPPGSADGIAVVETWGPNEDSPPAVATCWFDGIGGSTGDACVLKELDRDEARITGGLAAREDGLGGGIVVRPLETGTAVSVHHKLFDPRTQVLWWVPPLPGVHYDDNSTDGGLGGAVMSAGEARVLSCFGYSDDSDQRTVIAHDECYLLPVPTPLPGEALR